jgi:hypothetical protein
MIILFSGNFRVVEYQKKWEFKYPYFVSYSMVDFIPLKLLFHQKLKMDFFLSRSK